MHEDCVGLHAREMSRFREISFSAALCTSGGNTEHEGHVISQCALNDNSRVSFQHIMIQNT